MSIPVLSTGCSQWLANRIVLAPNHGGADAPRPPPKDLAAHVEAFPVEIKNPEGVLSVWVVDGDATTAPRGTILVLHGIRDNKRRMRSVAQTLLDEGYRAVLVDLRGHGESTGRLLTYGIVEAGDLSAVLDEVDKRGLLTGEVGVWGYSYGASVGIQLAASDPRIETVVALAPFSNAERIVRERMNGPFLGWLLRDSTVERSLGRANEMIQSYLRRASPEDAVKQCRATVLLVHGTEDKSIPLAHSLAIHKAAPGKTTLLEAPGLGHFSILSDLDVRECGLIWLGEQMGSAALPRIRIRP